MRQMVLILALASLLGLAPSPVSAKRVALVIGNNVYRNLPAKDQLKNAVSDAQAVKAALESLDFKVVLGENLDRTALVGKLSDFGARLEEGDVAFFFYAGHGVSFTGANYLLPSDIPSPVASGRDEEERMADLAVAETRVIDRIRRSGARIAVVVLDACRDNPLAISSDRSIGAERGLAPPPLTNGVLSIYAAGTGKTALDDIGDGDPNSVFTRVFVKQLKTSGLGLREMAFKTQGEVAKLASANGYDQVPGVYSEIIGDDFYRAGPPAATPTPVTNSEQADFDAALQSGSVAQWDLFLTRYPASPLADIVRRERDRLTKAPEQPVGTPVPSPAASSSPVIDSERADFVAALRSGSAAQLDLFLTRYPASPLADIVRGERDRSTRAAIPAEDAKNPADIGTSETENSLGLSLSARREVQQRLIALKFYPGPPDGDFGETARSAIREWQKAHNLAITGFLTRLQFAILKSESERVFQQLVTPPQPNHVPNHLPPVVLKSDGVRDLRHAVPNLRLSHLSDRAEPFTAKPKQSKATEYYALPDTDQPVRFKLQQKKRTELNEAAKPPIAPSDSQLPCEKGYMPQPYFGGLNKFNCVLVK